MYIFFYTFNVEFQGKENEIQDHEKSALVYHLSLNQDYAKNMEQQNFNIQQEMQVIIYRI